MSFVNRVRLLERHHAQRQPQAAPLTVGDVAGIVKRLLRGTLCRAAARLSESGGYGTRQFVALHAADAYVFDLDDLELLTLFRGYIRHLKYGTGKPPAPLECLRTADFWQHAETTLDAM